MTDDVIELTPRIEPPATVIESNGEKFVCFDQEGIKELSYIIVDYRTMFESIAILNGQLDSFSHELQLQQEMTQHWKQLANTEKLRSDTFAEIIKKADKTSGMTFWVIHVTSVVGVFFIGGFIGWSVAQ